MHHTFGELHDEPTIRVKLVHLCGALLRESSLGRAAQQLMTALVDVLVLYVADAWELVASSARGELLSLSASCLTEVHACV